MAEEDEDQPSENSDDEPQAPLTPQNRDITLGGKPPNLKLINKARANKGKNNG